MRLAVFASGHGSNLAAIAQRLPVSLVFSDNPQAPALSRVPDAKTVAFSPTNFPTRAEYETALAHMVHEHRIDLVALAGYMRLVGEPLLRALPGAIVNVHPSLLPSFPGKNAIERAFTSGVAHTGVTVHYVDAGMDTGPIIAQKPVAMRETLDELVEAVHAAEHELYPQVLEHIGKECL